MLWSTCLVLLLAIFRADSMHLKELKADNTHPCKAENLRTAVSYYCDKAGHWHCQNGWKAPENTTHFDQQNPCSIPVCTNPCVNGRCVSPETCACDVGWDGFTCGECVPLGGCLHGWCKEALECDCSLAKDQRLRNKYEGAHCDRPKCSQGCKHGFCDEPDECTCQNGWKGSSCDECMELPGCLHGSCEKHNGDKIPNSCHCEDGWMGHLCDQPICAKGCNMSHAHCTKPGECKCNTQYSGKTCDQCEAHWNCPNRDPRTNCQVANECICIDKDEVYCTSVIESTNCTRCYSQNTEECKDGFCHCKLGFRGKTCNETHNGRVLIATGMPYEDGRKTEIVDLSDPTFECTGLPDYPLNTKFGGGGLLANNTPIICGGYNGTDIGECFKLVDKKWNPMEDMMNEARNHAGYGNVVVNESLWKSGGVKFFGGEKFFDKLQNSSELINGNTSLKYSDLPEAMYAHCSIQINDSVILVTGGNSGNANKKTYYHNFKNGEWSDGPELLNARYMHACKSFYLNNEKTLVVAGGIGDEGKLKSVEFLSLEHEDKGWYSGNTTDLPEAMAEFSMVPSLDHKSVFAVGVVVGGKRDCILELSCDGTNLDSCNWENSPTKLKHPRENLVALLIPDSLVDELCN